MAAKTSIDPPLFVQFLNVAFRNIGYYVADNDKAVLIITLLISLIFSSKIAFTKQEDDIKTGYTPYGARSLTEISYFSNFFSSSGEPIAVFLFIVAKDNSSMAEREKLQEVVNILDYVGSNLTHKGHAFYDICTDFCQINEPIRHFTNGLTMESALSDNLDAQPSRFGLTFPLMQILGKELDLSPNLFGVRTRKDDSIEYAKIVMLHFRANSPQNWTKEDVAEYERSISHFFHKKYPSGRLNVYAMSLTFTGDEIVRTGLTIFPFIAVGFLIMTAFSIVTVYFSCKRANQWSMNKVTQAVLGCVCPMLATSSALGLLFWCGFRFGTILCVTPFLILAIGVDDAYLQIHACLRLSDEPNTLTKREKISSMLVEVGPSIAITSMTNLFAFLVGIYTPTPEISLFCAGNAVAIVFDFVYQITMYTAILSLTENAQMRRDSSLKRTAKPLAPPKPEMYESFLDGYSQWIANPFTHIALFSVFCVYLLVTIRGALGIRILLSPDKLVIADSPLLQINYLRDQFVLPNYTTVNILVQNPGNLSDPERLKSVYSLIESYENYPECLGPKFSHFFARDYESFEATSEEELESEIERKDLNATSLSKVDGFSKTSMHSFLSWPEFQHWNGFVKFDEDGRISRFWATVSYHGADFGDFQVRKTLLHRWRDTADAFPALNVSIFDDYAPFVDQLETILPATLSTSLCTLACMAVVCFLFMQNVFTVFVATLAITSICIGVFGFLAMWSIDLDPISMATTIMSIGFSVDFPAHITFHYFREGLHDPQSPPSKRVARALAAIGYPLLQCGISTILFVVCLLFVTTYMSEVFVKTMVLVVSLGLIHGLVVVPAFLCAFTAIHKSVFPDPMVPSQRSCPAWLEGFHCKMCRE
ncbi:unnamed protein product [Caenorhabditis auriculariae]|uniref:SSD domain-containing protein n=1 Tax=Caenorhabditis auriculariae TaxID=2777116 RepID=A0A8S1HQU9_9PELO|nr:unnamed protein product [Caenorhabditis auriculariae]